MNYGTYIRPDCSCGEISYWGGLCKKCLREKYFVEKEKIQIIIDKK